MPSTYELWLTDDKGVRLIELQNYAFFSYSRSLLGNSTFQIGLPYEDFKTRIHPIFEPDRRVEVWRSPDTDYPMRLEQIYLLRKPRYYTRESDGVSIVEFYGRSPADLLRRRIVMQGAGTSYTRKTGYIDDLMKEIVREQMLYGSALDEDGVVDNDRAFPEGEFVVQPNMALGPSVTVNCSEQVVLDVLKELKDSSFQLAKEATTNLRIFYDVVPFDTSVLREYILDEDADPILDEDGYELWDETYVNVASDNGFQFITIADLYGQDRTTGTVYSVENNNLGEPFYSKNHLDEANAIIVKGFGRGDSRQTEVVLDSERIGSSRWNRCEMFLNGSQEPEQSLLEDMGRAALWEGEPDEEIIAVFLNVPGGPDSPRSLYGIDWDLGDLLPVEYVGKRFDVEVMIVYVALNENGEENITGRNEVNDATD